MDFDGLTRYNKAVGNYRQWRILLTMAFAWGTGMVVNLLT